MRDQEPFVRAIDRIWARMLVHDVGWHPSFAARDQRPPPKPEQVAIVATTTKFQVRGRPAEVGQIYTVDSDIAASLIATSKAGLA